MKLLGDWNWYLPSWLEWLPHITPGPTPGIPESKAEPEGQADPTPTEA
jgi:hypothetical protein